MRLFDAELTALLRDPGHCLSLGLGAGCVRRAPGTWGSLIGLLLYLPLAPLPLPAQLAAVAAAALGGIWLCGRTAARLGTHDHGGIVWDEIVGMWIALLAAPASLAGWAGAFGLFRLFDIVKPWPISVADRRVQGGLGIMLDDIIAGVFALSVLKLSIYFI